MTPTREIRIRIEGYTADELLAALDEETEAVLFAGSPLVFRAGTATILGQFAVKETDSKSSLPRSRVAARRVLDRRGFAIREVPGKGECYHQLVELSPE